MGHARLPASGTKQWSICAGYPAWMEAHPGLVEGSGIEAQRGTAAHVLVERCLREGSQPHEYEDRIIQILNPDTDEEGASILRKGAKTPKGTDKVWFLVDQEMHEAVACMTEYVRDRCYELGLVDHLIQGPGEMGLAQATAEIVGKSLHLEVRVNPVPGRDDMGGTADTIIDAWPDMLETVDYKNGSGVFVPVEGNEQLKSYELGALVATGPAAMDYEELRYTICQPRHYQAPRDGIMSEDTTPEELMKFLPFLVHAAGRVDDARAAVAAGADLDKLFADGYLSTGKDGSHCRWCELQDYCPAAMAKVKEMIGADFDDDPEQLDVPDSHNYLSVLMPWIPFLEQFAKRVKEKTEELMFAGTKVEGQKIVRKKSSGRKFITETEVKDEDGVVVETITVSEDDIVKQLSVNFGLTEEQLRPTPKPKMLTGPATEKLIDKDRREEFSKDFLVNPPGALTIAPDSDVRPEVIPDNPADDFDDDED